jgi:hypothetical protein
MATNRRASHLRLVTVDGTQIAPAPRIARGGWKVRQDREITLAIIHEHLGHLTHEMWAAGCDDDREHSQQVAA